MWSPEENSGDDDIVPGTVEGQGYSGTLLDFARDNGFCYNIFHIALDGSFKRACTISRVVTYISDEPLGSFSDGKFVASLFDPFV